MRILKLLALAALNGPGNASVLGREGSRLISLADSENDEVRKAAINVIALIQPAPPDQALPVILKNLNDRDRAVQLVALGALVRFDVGRPQVARSLIDVLLGSSPPEVRNAAARALGQAAHPSAEIIDALIRALSDSDVYVRQTALLSLGNFGPQARSAIGAITKLANNPAETEGVRHAAKIALDSIRR